MRRSPTAVHERLSGATNCILSLAQHFATVQDGALSITGHLQTPGEGMPGRTPVLLCRTVPLVLLVVRIRAAVPRNGAGGTSNRNPCCLFQILFQGKIRFMLPLHFCVFTCLDFFEFNLIIRYPSFFLLLI